MEVKFKFWLEKGGEVIAGSGKANLLEKIDELGSIQKAAEEMKMSYRHAWGFIKTIEKHSRAKFVETQVGGRDGGGARLTPNGKDFLRRYLVFSNGLEGYIEKRFKKAFK
jgi:molybdate transport system regulatory protein